MVKLLKRKEKTVKAPGPLKKGSESDTDSKQTADATPAPKAPKAPKRPGFFGDEPPGENPLPNPGFEAKQHEKLIKRIEIQGYLIILLGVFFLILQPILQPTQYYYARPINRPAGSERRIVPLNIPNLTQQAVLSWSTTAVTEVMTFNFADYNSRISMFRDRFLPEGWEKFVTALLAEDVINKFKSFQLVLTAAPSDTPIIVSEGPNEKTGEYEWVIQVPVILKYVTNNNKNTRSNRVVELTLVRVSTLENPYGIAIKTWWSK